MKKSNILLGIILALAAVGVLFLLTQPKPAAEVPAAPAARAKSQPPPRHAKRARPAAAPKRAISQAPASSPASAPAPSPASAPASLVPAEAPSPAAQARQAFDALGESWREPAEPNAPKRTVTPEDQTTFAKAFAAVPDAEKPEAMHQALDLIADENFSVVAPLLLDMNQSEEILDILFSDMLNRPEGVKDELLPKIAITKGHPMRAEALRILDVTGALEKPAAQ